MKKSIGIIAAVLLTGSVYSQDYNDTTPHQRASTPELESVQSRDLENSTPNRAEFEAQSSLRDQQSQAKQGSTLSNEEAGQVLRNADDPDLAHRNQQLINPDPSQLPGLNADDQDPDAIYEEWILVEPQDVGRPAESESDSASSPDEERGSKSELNYADPHSGFQSEIDRARELNESRSYDHSDYSGAPASAQFGTGVKNAEECDLDHKNSGAAQSSESASKSSRLPETVKGSGSAVDSDERYRRDLEQSHQDSESSSSATSFDF